MPENIAMLDDAKIQKLQEKLDVNISIKPKQRQANKSVMIKAQVCFLQNLGAIQWCACFCLSFKLIFEILGILLHYKLSNM